MAWTATEGSHIFRPFVADVLLAAGQTGFSGLDADTVKVALYGNTGTPDNDVTLANSAYAVGQWVVGNEKSDTNWAAGGRTLGTQVINSATADLVFFDGADTAGGGNVTLANVYGDLVYDDSITAPTADPGICFNYFGGAQSVTAGTFTVIWSNSPQGIFRVTL